jgi:RNA polymerase sigma-70 factor (ECF subfamily)
MAQDLLQEIFIKIYIHLNDYDPCFPFSSWIYRIAHNEIVSFFRKEKRRSIVLSHNELVSLYQQIDDDNEDLALDNRMYSDADIQIALDRLDQKYKDILLLRFFETKSYEEISDILLIPQGTVATLINRAKKKIKASLLQKHCS